MIIISWHLTICINVICQMALGVALTRRPVIGQVAPGGKQVKSFMFKWKLIAFWLPLNIFYWRLGYCSFGDNYVSATKKIAVALIGAFATMLIAIPVFWLSIEYDWHYFFKQFFFVLFSTSAVFILLFLQKNNRVNYALTYNLVFCMDLAPIPLLRKLRGFDRQFLPALTLYESKQFKEAAQMIEVIIQQDCIRPEAYKIGIQSYIEARDFTSALTMHEAFTVAYSLTPADRAIAGGIKHVLGMYTESREDYDNAIDLQPDEPLFYNNRGYLFLSMKLYSDAIADFSQAAMLQPDLAYPYNNRGFAKLKSGQLEAGLQDIEKSLSLDPDNAMAWRNMGIYYEAIGNKAKALSLYLKAKEMEPETEDIDRLIEHLS